ncbi:homocysteine S-methyltransferase [Streptococcus ovuberis]|uniref:S-methylmethionine:homocysteine methyltransferase n=1 Tax=Streptococcus ovuberis TaxID=1936207 RepID=A0A7X6S2K2_9STRE|nr:homocysteine S-methyltransferase [Streptococcus ovuberis]NKZ21455.1 homocysteine S-methyltransferase [Streptococcus ovuberis]
MKTFMERLTEEELLILDGALGTELESRGYDVSGNLWSANYLLENPQVIKNIHLDYLMAGADLLTTSSYQATIPGLLAAGLTRNEAIEVIRLTVRLAQEARDAFWKALSDEERSQRRYPLIGGDVGPYAAFLANASEYTGDYGGVTVEALRSIHCERMAILLEAGVDFLCIETIPNRWEVEALLQLLAEEFSESQAYLSLVSLDGEHLPDGTELSEIAHQVDQSSQVLAVGINCSAPDILDQALEYLKQGCQKPLIAYPNSGEIYDVGTESWQALPADAPSLLDWARRWQERGTKILGGCCRTRPEDIAVLARGLKHSDKLERN